MRRRKKRQRVVLTESEKFRNEVLANYDLSAKEILLLEDACELIDLIDYLEETRPRVLNIDRYLNGHSALIELAARRHQLAWKLKQLDLRDEAAG